MRETRWAFRIATILGALCLMVPTLAASTTLYLQPAIIGPNYDTVLYVSNAAGTSGNLSVNFKVGVSSYGPYQLAIGPRQALSISIKDLFPNVPIDSSSAIADTTAGALEVVSDLPDGALLASVRAGGDWYSWQADAVSASTADSIGCVTAVASASHPLWLSVFNPATQSASMVLDGSWAVISSGAHFDLDPLSLELLPGESRVISVPSPLADGLAALEARVSAANSSATMVATLLALNPATGGASTSAMLEPRAGASNWALPYWTLFPSQRGYLVLPSSREASIAKVSCRVVGTSALRDYTLAFPPTGAPILADLAALLPDNTKAYEGMISIHTAGHSGSWSPASILMDTKGAAVHMPFQSLGTVVAGSLMSAPVSLGEPANLTIGLFNAGNDDVIVALRLRGAGVSSDPNDATFAAVSPAVLTLPKGTWTSVALSDLLAHYGPYDSVMVELLQSGPSGTVYSSALSAGSIGIVNQPLAALPLAVLPTFKRPLGISGPSPVELTPGETRKLEALLLDPATGQVHCPLSWKTRNTANGPTQQVSVDNSGLLSASPQATGSGGFTIVPMMLPIDPGGNDFGDDVPDPGEGVLYAPGPMPVPTAVIPHFGRLAGGDSVDIIGTGFDPAGVEAKFRRTKTDGSYCSNKVQGSCTSGCTTTSRTDAVGNIISITATDIGLGPSANCPNCGTPSSCRPNAFGSARVIVKNLATGNKNGISYTGGGFRYGWPEPTIKSISPTTGPVSGGTTVTISGDPNVKDGNFADDNRTAVFIGGIQATVVSRTNCIDGLCNTITAVTGTATKQCTNPAGQTGAATVKVKNPDFNETTGYGVGSLASGFTLTNPPAPILGSITPASGTSAGGTPITLTGTNLMRISQITFGTATVQTAISCNADRTTVTFTSPASLLCGTVPVKITTVDGQVTSTLNYTYTAAAVSGATLTTPSPSNCSNGGLGKWTGTLQFHKGPMCETFAVYLGEITIAGTSACGVPASSYISVKSLDGTTNTDGLGTVTITFNLPPISTVPPFQADCVFPYVGGLPCYPFDPVVTVPVHTANGQTNFTFTVHITN